MDHPWTVEDHLRDADPAGVALYRDVEAFLLAMDDVTVSVSKTTITFKGLRRGFAGARPAGASVRGYLDLMRAVGGDPRITNTSPYTKRLWVHQYRLRSPDDLDETFRGWLAEAHRVGQGDHLR